MNKSEYLGSGNNEKKLIANISEYGQRVLGIVEENKGKNGLDFGDLIDLDKSCILIVNNDENDYEALEFNKKIFLNALKKVTTLGEMFLSSGTGTAIQKKSNTSNESQVFLYLGLNYDASKLIFDFRSKSLNPQNDFVINKHIELDANESGVNLN